MLSQDWSSSGSIPTSSFLTVHYICSHFLLWNLEWLRVVHEGWNLLLPNSSWCRYLTCPHESWMLSGQLGLWLPGGGLRLTLPRPTRSVTVCGSCGLRTCASSLRRLESQNDSLIHGLKNGCCVNVSRREHNIHLIVSLHQSSWGTQVHCQQADSLKGIFFFVFLSSRSQQWA